MEAEWSGLWLLPDDIVIGIFKLLSAQEMSRVELVAKSFLRPSSLQGIWKELTLALPNEFLRIPKPYVNDYFIPKKGFVHKVISQRIEAGLGPETGPISGGQLYTLINVIRSYFFPATHWRYDAVEWILTKAPEPWVLLKLISLTQLYDARTFQRVVDGCIENSSPAVMKKILNLYNSKLKRSFKLYLIEACGNMGNLDSLLPLLFLRYKDPMNTSIAASLRKLAEQHKYEDILNSLVTFLRNKISKLVDGKRLNSAKSVGIVSTEKKLRASTLLPVEYSRDLIRRSLDIVDEASCSKDFFPISEFVIELMIRFGWYRQVMDLSAEYNHIVADSIFQIVQATSDEVKDATCDLCQELFANGHASSNTRLLSAYLLLGLKGFWDNAKLREIPGYPLPLPSCISTRLRNSIVRFWGLTKAEFKVRIEWILESHGLCSQVPLYIKYTPPFPKIKQKLSEKGISVFGPFQVPSLKHCYFLSVSLPGQSWFEPKYFNFHFSMGDMKLQPHVIFAFTAIGAYSCMDHAQFPPPGPGSFSCEVPTEWSYGYVVEDFKEVLTSCGTEVLGDGVLFEGFKGLTREQPATVFELLFC